jgi:hypothetical protein
MVNRHTAKKIRKTHRYLGLFLGIQFIMWTVSGLYFSWTDIDEIHGDQFRKENVQQVVFKNLKSPSDLGNELAISSLELKEIANNPYYWINQTTLIDARTGSIKEGLTKEDGLLVAEKYMIEGLEVTGIERIDSTGNHHEYRGGPLPAYVISFDTPGNVKAYIALKDGSFETLRHRDWRWFDFLWMTHTMDYEGRDDFNNIILRAFSILGLITVLSGFTLWFTTSPTIRKIFKKNKKKNKKKNEKIS